MRIKSVAAAGLFVVLLSALGCGNSNSGQVTGLIQLDGKPLDEGQITFFPEDGKTKTTGGKIETGGRYSVLVPAGTMKVVISAPKVVGKKKIYPTPDSPEMPITKESLPSQYSDMFQTKLRLEVVAGPNEKNWELKGK
jgi:hypothetical protein